eukprot:750038-Hanusia_phi.AAC.8
MVKEENSTTRKRNKLLEAPVTKDDSCNRMSVCTKYPPPKFSRAVPVQSEIGASRSRSLKGPRAPGPCQPEVMSSSTRLSRASKQRLNMNSSFQFCLHNLKYWNQTCVTSHGPRSEPRIP